ncbi:endolytic transglycosylase MltG [Anaerosporobacter sp.]|uniref:endolytic transglycosylase MltG n=1 Tax=Anaerosporobacter sp. TaxID=1872529 RepID=UPI00286F8264|nr:endolytic transglycosylase MltG [Anaerosporobacter sp.]
MKEKRMRNRMLISMMIVILFGCCIGNKPLTKIEASSATKYGVLIADAKGKYTFYDWNAEKGAQRMIKKSSNIMLPLRKTCSALSDINYSYDFKTNKATVTNIKNGKKIVFTKGSKTAYTYASSKAKAKKVTLKYKMYLDSDSNAAMVEASALSYVLSVKTGYQYYSDSSVVANAGYSIKQYAGIIVLNPYKKVSSLPDATKVNYVSEKVASNIKKVTIPEGYSVAQTFELLVSKGVCASTKALFAAEKKDFSSFTCIASQLSKENRCFTLEGYLYPDTYEFYGNSEPIDVLKKIVANADKKLTDAYYTRAEELGYSLDEILVIASIIEKETGKDSERASIASVLHNRLNAGMKLQCDCSIHYIEKYVKPYISGDVNRYNSYYNTYKCKALPEGAIASPGKKAIQAALYPKETQYFYFCSDKDGGYHYFVTYEEQLAFLNSLETEEVE